jgi:hypothetical protein
MVTRKVTLSVNDAPIELNDFIEGYIYHIVEGITASLKGTEEIEGIDLTVNGDQVSIVLNNKAVPLNLFASRIIRSTIMGIVSTLKGGGASEKIRVSIRR